MKWATVVGGTIFFFGSFLCLVTLQPVVEQVMLAWQAAKESILLVGTTIFGGMLLVWGMGWTLSDKDRQKMKNYNKLRAEKIKKQKELEMKRKRLLRKHGLDKEPK